MSYRSKQPQLSLNLLSAVRNRPCVARWSSVPSLDSSSRLNKHHHHHHPPGHHHHLHPPSIIPDELETLDIKLPNTLATAPTTPSHPGAPSSDSSIKSILPPSHLPSSTSLTPISPDLPRDALIDRPPRARTPPALNSLTPPATLLRTPFSGPLTGRSPAVFLEHPRVPNSACAARPSTSNPIHHHPNLSLDRPNLQFFTPHHDPETPFDHHHPQPSHTQPCHHHDPLHNPTTSPASSSVTSSSSNFSSLTSRSPAFSHSAPSASSCASSDSRPAFPSSSPLGSRQTSQFTFPITPARSCITPTSIHPPLPPRLSPSPRSIASKNPTCSSPTGSAASLESTFDPNLALVPPDLPSPWPVPPSSSTTHSPLPFRWPQKSNTYHPLRTWSNAPRPDPPPSSSHRSFSTLAYLDLSSSSKMASHPSGHPELPSSSGNPSNPPSGLHRAIGKARPPSLISQQSDRSDDTIYQDAAEKAEWMDIDTGDAYADLEQTEHTARRISQRLLVLNNVDFLKTRTRHPTPPNHHRPPDSVSVSAPSSSTQFNHPSRVQRQSSPSTRCHDCHLSSTSNSSAGFRDSPPSNPSSAFDHEDHDSNPPSRSRSRAGRHSIGSVPLFTRASLHREDRDDDGRPCALSSRREPSGRLDEDELEAIQEAPNLEKPDTAYPTSPSPPAGSNPRRRLKPLILRSTPTIVGNPRNRPLPSSSTVSPKTTSGPTDPEVCDSPKHLHTDPQYHRQAHNTIPTAPLGCNEFEGWRWSEKASMSDDSTLKDSEPLSTEPIPGQSLKASHLASRDLAAIYISNQSDTYPRLSLKEHFDSGKLSISSAPCSESVKTTSYRLPQQKSTAFDQKIKLLTTNMGKSSGQSDEDIFEETTSVISPEPESCFPPIIQEPAIPTEHETQKALYDDADDLTKELNNFLAHQAPPKPAATGTKSRSSIVSMLTVRKRTGSLHTPVVSTHSLHNAPSICASEGLSPGTDTTLGAPRRRLSSLCVPRQALLQAMSSMKTQPTTISCIKRSSANMPVIGELPGSSHSNPTIHVPQQAGLLQIPSHEGRKNQGPMTDGLKGDTKIIRTSRLFSSLSRMQAQDAQVMDILAVDDETRDHLQSRSSGSTQMDRCPSSSSIQLQEAKKIKGKLKHISKPTLLDGERERDALWKMISFGRSRKLSSGYHRKTS